MPLFNLLLDKIEHVVSGRNSLSEVMKEGADACWAKLQEYYSKTSWLLCAVTILDPRFNVKYFKDSGWERRLIDQAQDQ